MLIRWACVIACVAGFAARADAQTRQITGTVVEEGSNAPISSAQIQVKGTTIGVLAEADGSFTLNVPTGDVVLAVRRVSYSPAEVPVPASQSTVQIVLKKDVLQLEQVVVTGQATGISKRNLANSVATVSAEQITKVSSQSIDQALQGKVVGAQIQTNSGAPGGGNRIRIRGISSILGNAQPLYVIDGVIVSDMAIASGTNKVTRASGSGISVSAQENPDNRISDLNPNDIASVEVLKGSAAAAIYGSKASGGVILITTKRGRTGAPAFSLRTSIGTSALSYRNGSRRFRSLEDAVEVFGSEAADYWDPTRVIDYEDELYGNHPINYETSLSISGGSENTQFYVSGLLRKEDGIVTNTYGNKKSLLANLDQQLGDRLKLSVGSQLIRNDNDRGLFGNDNRGNSIGYALTKIPSFLDLRRRADGSFPENPFWPSNPLQTVELFQNQQTVWRNVSTLRATFDAVSANHHTLQLIAYGGADLLNQRNNVYSPPELQYERTSTTPGKAAVSNTQNLQGNINLNAVHTWTPNASVSVTSQIGSQYELRTLNQTRTAAENLLGGLSVVTAGTVRDLDETRQRVEDFGIFAQTEVLLDERLFLTLGARADRSSNNGDPGKFFFFPKASASYRFPDLVPGLLDELKLRAAYGETGNQPLYGQKFTPLELSNIDGLGGFRVGSVRGATDIRPERQREYEIGADATILGKRGTLELTGFVHDISDLLITRTLPPTAGYSSEVSNGAAMRVWGTEAALDLFVLQREKLQWQTRINWAMNRSKITDLPVPAFLISSPQVGAVKIEEGKSATQIIGNDTLPEPGRKVVQVVIGDGNPDWTAGWSNTFTYGPFTLYGLIDHQEGGMLADGTWRHYDLGQNSADYDDLTPTGQRIGDVRRTSYLQVTKIYYQDATFTKLRELTLSVDLPERLWKGVLSGVENAQLSLSGRNLYTWTDFRGTDPEFFNYGATGVPDAVQRNREIAPYPPSRTFWLTLSLGF
jgi:TonB-linked SusC/RagA family outer membrane protein